MQSREKERRCSVRRSKEKHSRENHSQGKLFRGNKCKEKLKESTRRKEAEICIIWQSQIPMSHNHSFHSLCHIHSQSWSMNSQTNHPASRKALESMMEELQNLEILLVVAWEEAVRNGNGAKCCINKMKIGRKEANLRSQEVLMEKSWRVSNLNCNNRLKCSC